VVEALCNALDEAKLPRCRIHDLRHTLATLLRKGEIDLRTIQDQLGHADPGRTSGIYVGRDRAALRRAAGRVQQLLAAALTGADPDPIAAISAAGDGEEPS
jgi:integrase